MQSEDARYLKRKIRFRSIDVHPTEKALVVNYELEALILGDLGDPLLGDCKECQKIIRLKSLNEDTNCAALAKEVVGKCSLIHPSKLEEVEQLIYYLQNRKNGVPVAAAAPIIEQNDVPRPESSCSGTESPSSAPSSSTGGTKANINSIESYVELLYEDIPEKVTGSANILQLARNPDNLEELGSNESVLSALSRVLREDWKKSIELSTNIIYIFFCFSTYSQFHHIILQYKIGSLCMEVIDYELRRYDQWRDDLEARRKKIDALANQQGETGRTSISEHRRSISHIPVAASADIRRRGPDPTVPTEPKDELRRMKEDLEKMKRKFQNLTKKQDQLLRVSLYLLLNIAEDTRVEDKMRKKNITGMLTKTLDRDNIDLLILVLTFLKKLSLFRENVDDMTDLNVVEKLPRILMMNSSDLVHITLKLLLNLSFSTPLRDRMVRVGLLPKLVSLLGEERHESIVLKVLYHQSMDDRCKSMFTYTDCVPLLMNMLLEREKDEVNLELIALCINLAINQRNAQMMVENNRLQSLMARAFRNQDSLIMKVIRNIAMHESTKHNFVEFVGDIAKAVVECGNEDFVVECVGVLGYMTLPDLDFSQLMQRFNLIPWIQNILVPGKYEDDLVLEVVVLLGTAAADEGCAMLLCKADILLSLIELLKAKQEDDEMVLQIIYVFYMISRHTTTRDYLIKETEAPAYLIDLMHDKNNQIRNICNHCLDIIAGWNKEWAERIKLEKFRWHNSQWLEMVENSIEDKNFDLGQDGDDDLPPFLNGDLMHNTLLFPSGSEMSLNMANEDSNERPKSGRYSRDLEMENCDEVRPKSVVLTSSKSSEDIACNGLSNLILGPIMAEGEHSDQIDARCSTHTESFKLHQESVSLQLDTLLQASCQGTLRVAEMLVENGSPASSLLDSPTLARVERATRRQEQSEDNNQQQQAGSVQLVRGGEMHAIKKGLLWQQRDRMFSRWKERYFILTRDYLHCFKRSTGSDKISEMGQFIFKVKLVEVERVEWINKKSYSTVALVLARDGRVLLRAADGLEDWFELLEECMLASKERRRALRSSHDPSWQRSNTDSINSSLEEWLLARHKIAGLQHLSDSVPDLPLQEAAQQRKMVSKLRDDEEEEQEQWLRPRPPRHEQRLSLLTDIDINSCDMQLETPPPSVPSTFRGRPTSYRLNSDVFFMSAAPPQNELMDRVHCNGGTATPSFCSSRSVLTPVGSFRSTHLFNPKLSADRYSVINETSPLTRYRDRSHSDAHRMDRHNWKTRAEVTRRTSYVVHATQV